MATTLLIWEIFFAIISYLIGSIPFSYIVAFAYGKNLYKVGSGNVGTANVYRATGKAGATILALAGDVGKGFFSIYLVQKFSGGCFLPSLTLTETVAAFFVVVGHNWPIFLKFKGGRGLAALAGTILALNWKVLFLVLIVIGFFIFITELIMRRGIKLEAGVKAKLKKLFAVFISQVLGRMIGILAAAILVFIFYPQIFKALLAATIISGIKHIKRTKTFLEGKVV